MTDDVAAGGLPIVVAGTGLPVHVAATGLPVLGHSREGRPIHGGRIRLKGGDGPALPAGTRLLLFGGIHGDEPASVAAILAWLTTRAESRRRPRRDGRGGKPR